MEHASIYFTALTVPRHAFSFFSGLKKVKAANQISVIGEKSSSRKFMIRIGKSD